MILVIKAFPYVAPEPGPLFWRPLPQLYSHTTAGRELLGEYTFLYSIQYTILASSFDCIRTTAGYGVQLKSICYSPFSVVTAMLFFAQEKIADSIVFLFLLNDKRRLF